MKASKNSLRYRFLVRIVLVLLITALLSGGVQLYFIKQQIAQETHNQAELISQSVNNGIVETSEASTAIEHQIDLKLLSMSENIAEILRGKELSDITNQDLTTIQKQLGLAGITILAPKDGDIRGVLSTDPEELHFSLKKVGFLKPAEELLNGNNEVPIPGATYAKNGIVILPISQSIVHNTPEFFKYAYYHAPHTNYLINAYVKAQEVYQFTQQVGTEQWIDKVSKNNPYVEEIAVLTPKVFVHPELAKKLYSPMKKIVHGQFNLHSKADDAILRGLAAHKHKVVSIQRIEDKKIYKMFLPIADGKVIYIALNYSKLSALLYRHSIVLIITGFVSLIALFILTIRFFNQIYQNIQKIITQIGHLASGDFTGKSSIHDGSELQNLSESANRMTDTLRSVLMDTNDHAADVQRLSYILENDAYQSVQQMYAVSTEMTMNQRESTGTIMDFLNNLEAVVQSAESGEVKQFILQNIGGIKELATAKAADTTDITLRLSDLLTALHAQSKEMAAISDALLDKIKQFILTPDHTSN